MRTDRGGSNALIEMTVLSRDSDQAVVRLSRDLVADCVPDLRSQICGILDEGVRELLLDLSLARTVDASGIGLLIFAHNSLAQRGGRLALVHASPEIASLLHMMRIDEHFSVNQG